MGICPVQGTEHWVLAMEPCSTAHLNHIPIIMFPPLHLAVLELMGCGVGWEVGPHGSTLGTLPRSTPELQPMVYFSCSLSYSLVPLLKLFGCGAYTYTYLWYWGWWAAELLDMLSECGALGISTQHQILTVLLLWTSRSDLNTFLLDKDFRGFFKRGGLGHRFSVVLVFGLYPPTLAGHVLSGI